MKGAKQRHSPVRRSQSPTPPHSAIACALFGAVGMSAAETPAGQTSEGWGGACHTCEKERQGREIRCDHVNNYINIK